MAALQRGLYANFMTPFFEPNRDPLIVSSIVGLSSINGSPYSPGGGGGGTISQFSTLSVSSMSVSSFVGDAGSLSTLAVSTINGKPYPDPTDAVAYANLICLSSFNLAQNSTTLVSWSSSSPDNLINTSGTDTVVGLTATYKIGCSYQFNNQSGSDVVRYFFLINDTPVANSASFQTIANNTEQVSYSELIQTLNNGDKIQFGVYTASADIYLSTLGSPSGEVPTSPAAIGTIYKIA